MYKDLLNIGTNVKKCPKETLTPYKIAVVILIKEYCSETTKAIVERRDFCILALKLIQSPDLDLRSLLKLIRSEEYILQRLASQLENKFELLYEMGVKGLLDLSDSLMHLMDPALDLCHSHPALNKNSVLGLYTRRIVISLEKLSFYQVVALYESFKSYYHDTWGPDNSRVSIGLDNNDSGEHKNKVVWGGRQAELLVAQQALALQTDEQRALPPAELQGLVKELLNCSPYYAEAHYLSYLNCLRVNEYCGAVDSLYHCFDRLAPFENRTPTEDRNRTFRYAALNLAALHAQFGHKKVALAALNEAIMLAQEAGDNVCLQHAHSWMYHLIDDQKGQLIERSVGKASMLGITHTTSLGLIASAHYNALESKSPPEVFETLVKSDVLNCQHSMADLMSMSYVEKAALWTYYGKTKMSSLCSQLLLLHNAGDKKHHMFNGSSTCQAVVNVANTFVELGEYTLAEVVLSHAKDRFPNEPSSKIWMLSEQLHQFTRIMRHEKWSEAEAIAVRLSSIDPLESKFRRAEVSLAKGDYPGVMELIGDIQENKGLDPLDQVRVMILSSQVMCSSRLPGLGTTGANPLFLLNTALEIADRKYLSYQQAIIKMHLANIQLTMDMPSRAMNLVDDAIIPILSHGGCFDRGRAFVLYAKCLVASSVSDAADVRNKTLHSAINVLCKAKDHFNKIEAFSRVKSTLYLMGMLYNELDLKAERNRCAFEYRQLDVQFPTKADTIAIF
ncbi:anaphase-promoting complex subunit 5 isoform X2 [Athalia rosae]|uniref:anaphase-promoting complex subunit 5 isoform X2 n=1 Tax=Athalia rosae TaxID=37344 RepID=UPI00203487D4|nr:anaphase-promoting complex subunit 5 isoform X2 [Athalia rosae]